MSPDVRAALGPLARGLELSPPQEDQLRRYAESLHAWNQRIRLTGATSVEAILAEHVADALPLLPHLPERPFRVLDVGSGAGLPGIPIAILRPDARVTLLEPNGKKHAFLRAMIRELPLPNTEALRARLEDLPPDAAWDVAVSRATWPLTAWLERAHPTVRPGGRILAQTGPHPPNDLPPAAHLHPYPLAGTTRHVVTLTTAAA